MIGYYVHHQGRGHLHRAQSLSEVAHAELGEPVTGLSSLTRPAGWPGPWVQLPRDDRRGPVPDDTAHDTTAHAQLHWVPLGDAGLRERAAAVSAWIQQVRPRAVVVDVSVEVALLVRLHGVPVVSMVLPGDRTDTAHLTGFRVSSALTAAWPAEAGHGGADLTPGMPEDLRARLQPLGAISRFACARPGVRRPGRPRAVLLQGQGGGPAGGLTLERLHALAPQWDWRLLGSAGEWVEDPSPVVLDADVVLTGSGQGSLADVAALRRPAVVVPEPRPHGEQAAMAAALAQGDWPVVVAPSLEDAVTSGAMERACRLDGESWSRWCDGQGAGRLASVVRSVALPPAPGTDGVPRDTVAVVTIAHGRHDHLGRQQRSLGAGDRPPDHWVVVAMGDPWLESWTGHDGPVPDVVALEADPARLPLAAARNRGADRALERGAEVLVFLDVDCLAGPTLVQGYDATVRAHPGTVWSGPVTYLPAGLDEAALAEPARLDEPHPARPAPAPGELVHGAAPELFWSLSFALSRGAWERSGGFHEAYAGYGGEDTDFARTLAERGLDLGWVGDARAYHQHHPVQSPPVDHLDDILRNGALFAHRWGSWPMGGWLERFEELGLVERTTSGWSRRPTAGG